MCLRLLADGTWNVPATLADVTWNVPATLADGTWNVPATIGGFDTETPRAWFSIDERKLIEIENQSASVFQPVFLNVAFQSVSLACLWGSA